MLPIYLDITNEAIKIINENIWCMFELLEEICKGLSYEEVLDAIFPQYILDSNIDKCIRTIKELKNMSKDKYEREYLSPFYEWTLYHTIAWWIDVADDIELHEIPKEHCINEDGINMYETLNNVNNYFDFLFADWDFLNVEIIYAIYKRNPKLLDIFLHIDITQYVELMPIDIQKEYSALSKDRTEYEKAEEKQELFIIRNIYNYLQLESMKTKKYEHCSEADLSDNIRNGLFQLFKEHNLHIEREVRGGYAVKDLGELDFFIYSFDNEIYRKIAIGENKKWGEYENCIGQLLGYMDSDTQFGFTIIYNTDTQLKTVLNGRKKILRDFNIDGKFKIIGDIDEMENMETVLKTCHENPEKPDDYIYLYHFIFNIYKPYRKIAAATSRTRTKIKKT